MNSRLEKNNQKQRKNAGIYVKTAFWEKRAQQFKTLTNFNPVQNRILEQRKVDHENRQIWF